MEYLSFLAASNGAEGDIGLKPGWLIVWSADEVLRHNRGYQVPVSLPGCFAFGTNGGGELLVFDTTQVGPFPVLMVPFIPMQLDHAVTIAKSFSELQTKFGILFEETA